MKRIIWVDDDLVFMKDMREMFYDHGFLITTCTSLTEAQKYLKSGLTKNLLVDVEFPNSRKEGLTFLEYINDNNEKLNIVIYTGYPETDDAVKVIKNKLAADYIKKGDLGSEYKKNEFFKRLHNSFKDEPYSGFTGNNKFLTIKEFEEHKLLIWRLRTIIALSISFLILGLYITYLYVNNSSDLTKVLKYFDDNRLASVTFAFIYSLVNLFLVQDLYNKYKNHANINNYIKRNITPFIPKYLK